MRSSSKAVARKKIPFTLFARSAARTAIWRAGSPIPTPSPARRPLTRAFQSSNPAMQAALDIEMRKALQKAIKEFQREAGDVGGI